MILTQFLNYSACLFLGFYSLYFVSVPRLQAFFWWNVISMLTLVGLLVYITIYFDEQHSASPTTVLIMIVAFPTTILINLVLIFWIRKKILGVDYSSHRSLIREAMTDQESYQAYLQSLITINGDKTNTQPILNDPDAPPPSGQS
eukprot:TRINITY_DN4074_c0_g1_i1.p1 TRINITY_DN4074_c0_g1~~TRINITY_DN4074_c0_g1_i1.p1  ORF type:complete len:145 (-),score=14.90 TRINITY_DN4074_c0_g1_i1:447-881(-)